ncbi:CDP-alcohol phosphatidyltransferase family protein [Arthrobacter sp. MMS18-M83]|uniref:CDP-alcohol phosphatidyltransferase family protein n=1 Tax=Arthrobacter sp. MMS18-M83 TaxID=2996261 RepID=UPI00227CB3F4|nr:CDP-alcohol phosphatidyltransferase family protein [Arthrobacter sp. MMS18-M83]WAH98179.1 CDP-alcohol phosphatidyltransferase family protein [Arthrobacter sp. MMS18-M83]
MTSAEAPRPETDLPRPATPGRSRPPRAAGRAPGQTADRLCVESRSRSATDELLRGLRDEGWGITAWSHFLGRATLRSIRQAIHHAPALAEATALHAGLAVAAHPRHRRWVAASWLLTVTHLGMLENRRTLGPANVLTLIRANLPAMEDRLGPSLPMLALATDFLDGRISRATGTETPFGRYADFLADAALWNWYAARHEPSRWLRIAGLAAWVLPIAAVATSSFAGARMKDVPRSPWIRPAAALEILLGARALQRTIRSRQTGRLDISRKGIGIRPIRAK